VSHSIRRKPDSQFRDAFPSGWAGPWRDALFLVTAPKPGKSAMASLNDGFLPEASEFPGRVDATLGLFALSLLVFLSVTLYVPVRPVRAEVRLVERGINLGNALDAPTEGSWGVTLKPEYFEIIERAGFTSIRLPIRWSAHASSQPPYIIAPDFLARVDWAIGQALARKMRIIINMHNYVELYEDPEGQLGRLMALWDQIGFHYRNFPQKLFFELVNEPSGQLTDERWQEMFPKLLQTVRKTNPERMIIIGPSYWNSLDHCRANDRSYPRGSRRMSIQHGCRLIQS
jgi:hypothetical protein